MQRAAEVFKRKSLSRRAVKFFLLGGPPACHAAITPLLTTLYMDECKDFIRRERSASEQG